jgi:glycosyltransferase involved in cell wall biosynthesis
VNDGSAEAFPRMTVLHLRADAGVYGAERVILTLAKEQRRRGIDAQVLCIERPGVTAFYDRLRAEGVPAHRIESHGRFDGHLLLELRRLIDDEIRPQVLHSHSYKTDAMLALLCGLLRRRPKLVATNHLWTHETLRLRAYEALDALAFRFFDRVVAVSRAIGDEMRTRGVPDDTIEVIPNGLDFAELGAEAPLGGLREEIGVAPHELLVGAVGRLSPQKGLDHLVRAAAELAPRRDLRFVIVGEGPLRADIERQIQEHGLEGRVLLLGRRDDVPQILGALDIFVLPSLREGTPMALLEAMGAGVAAIASDVGGVRDVVDEGRTGLMVPSADASALARAIARLADDAALRTALGRAAKDAVRLRFSAGAMERRYESVYRGIAAWAARAGAPPVDTPGGAPYNPPP